MQVECLQVIVQAEFITVFSAAVEFCLRFSGSVFDNESGGISEVLHLIEIDAWLDDGVDVLLEHIRYGVVPHRGANEHCTNKLLQFNQQCGEFEMIYSASDYDYDFSEFRIRPQ